MGNMIKGTKASVEEDEETRRKLHMIKVKFLQVAHRLGETSTDPAAYNLVVADVSYRLGLAEQLLRGGHTRSTNHANDGGGGDDLGHVGDMVSKEQFDDLLQEGASMGQQHIDLSCTVLVLGKTGVGKSATINSILGSNEDDKASKGKVRTDAFQVGTRKIQEVVGTVEGINIRLIDTPGVSPCSSDHLQNGRILRAVKSFIKNKPPDIVLYIDRLDFPNGDGLVDKLLLGTITKVLGPSIWMNAIVVLTHAASAPPPHNDDDIESYRDMFVTRRAHEVQQAILQACGAWELRTKMSLSFVLAENNPHHHYSSGNETTVEEHRRVGLNGQKLLNWKPYLLLLCFALKVLAQAKTYLKLQQANTPRPFHHDVPPLVAPLPLKHLIFFMDYGAEMELPRERIVDDLDLKFPYVDVDLDLDKDKCDLKVQLTSSMKQTTSSLLFDMTAREGFRSYRYLLCCNTRFVNYFRHKKIATAGLYISRDVDSREKLLTVGLKLGDQLISNKWINLELVGGSVTNMLSARGGDTVAAAETVYEGVLQATLFPLLSTIGLVVMNKGRNGGLGFGGYFSNQILGGRSRNLIVSANVVNGGHGKLSVSFKSSKHITFAMVGLLLPLLVKMHTFYQQMLHGNN